MSPMTWLLAPLAGHVGSCPALLTPRSHMEEMVCPHPVRVGIVTSTLHVCTPGLWWGLGKPVWCEQQAAVTAIHLDKVSGRAALTAKGRGEPQVRPEQVGATPRAHAGRCRISESKP